MSRGETLRSAACDALAVAGIALFATGLYFAWQPAAWLFSGGFLFWAALVLRGRIR